MNLRYLKRAGVALCGLLVLVLAGCPGNNDDDDDDGPVTTAVSFPVVDGVSSASILRVDDETMVYVGKSGGSDYKLNKVSVDNNTSQLTSTGLGGNAAILAAANGKIAVIVAEETGYEAFTGQAIKIYNTSLQLLHDIPFNPPAAGAHLLQPLHHRDPGLALGDKYVAVVAVDTEASVNTPGTGNPTKQHYISIYDLAGAATASHNKAFDDSAGAIAGLTAIPNPAINIGTPVALATYGDYLIAGGNVGTAVFKINNVANVLSLTSVTASDSVAAHWMKSNSAYVLESKSGTGQVKVWKWNTSAAPTALGAVTVNGGGTGSVQALSLGLDSDDANNAYFYARGGTNVGEVLKATLNPFSATPTVLFKLGTYNTYNLAGLWNIERRHHSTDNYFIFSGQIAATTEAVEDRFGVLVFQNPPSDGSAVTYNPGTVPFLVDKGYTSAVRTLKTFVNSSHDILYAAKNYSSNPIASAAYTLKLMEVNDD